MDSAIEQAGNTNHLFSGQLTVTDANGFITLTATSSAIQLGNLINNQPVIINGQLIHQGINSGGLNFFSSSMVVLRGGSSGAIVQSNKVGATDAKAYDSFVSDGGNLTLRTINDAYNDSHVWLTVSRNGLAVIGVIVGNTIDATPLITTGDIVANSGTNVVLRMSALGPNIKITSAVGAAGIAQTADESGTLQNIGYRGLPQTSFSTNISTALVHRGGHLLHLSGSPHTVTISAGGTTGYNPGDTITIVNSFNGGAVTIQSSDTLFWSLNNTTGSRTLGPSGICTLLYVGSAWNVSGSNLT